MLEIPAWVPAPVAAIAREMHASLDRGLSPSQDQYRLAIERLARDVRMRRVWQELLKANRSGPNRGAYCYPASIEAVRANPRAANAKGTVQDQACRLLFIELAQLRAWGEGSVGPRAITEREVAGRIMKLRAAADRLRAEARHLRDLGIGHLSPAVEAAADECFALANLEETFSKNDVLIVARKAERDDWERGFILSAAHLLDHLFGQKMQGLVAVLASVVFNKTDITEAQVNGMFRRGGVH